MSMGCIGGTTAAAADHAFVFLFSPRHFRLQRGCAADEDDACGHSRGTADIQRRCSVHTPLSIHLLRCNCGT